MILTNEQKRAEMKRYIGLTINVICGNRGKYNHASSTKGILLSIEERVRDNIYIITVDDVMEIPLKRIKDISCSKNGVDARLFVENPLEEQNGRT